MSTTNYEPREEREYRANEDKRNHDGLTTTQIVLRAIFGVFMIIVYVGMGVLLLINFFDWEGTGFTICRWIVGIILIIYGFFRAWRLYKGIDGQL